MAENKKKKSSEQDSPVEQDINEQNAQSQQDTPKDDSELEKIKQDYSDMYDKYLRLVAEFDNFKKRTLKEKAEVYSAAKIDVVEKLLPVIDNLERAELYSEPEKVLEGLSLIIKQFKEYLEKLDIHEIAAQDCEFNPELHNAVMREEGDEPGKILEVFQKGYRVKDKIIRYAMVKVCSD